MRLLFIAWLLFCPTWLCAQRIPLRAERSQRIPESEIHAQQRKLNQVFRHITDTYVNRVNPEAQTETAIRAMLAGLDPHSTYLTAEEMERARENLSGEFCGIGIEFNTLRDTLIAVTVLPDAPADRAGLRPGDRIVRIDTVSAVGLDRKRIPNLLRGARGSHVALEVVRRGMTEPLHLEVVRDRIPIHTVDAAYLVDGHTGYIKVNRFGYTTMEEFRRAFSSLGEIDALILDLRGNSGGILGQAVELAGFFLPRGTLIASTEGRAVPSTPLRTSQEGMFTEGKLVVLIDEESASGSEIVAGAIQDWDRGWIIGRPSFGKGLVQRQFVLQDGSAIRLTIARYHTPSGRVIQRPYRPGERRAYYLDHLHRRNLTPDSLTTGAPTYHTLRLGRTVYGGGGIIPDQLIPADTTTPAPWLVEWIRRGVVNEFSIDYLDRHRPALEKRYPTAERFAAEFNETDELLMELSAYAAQQGLPCLDEADDASTRWLKLRMRNNLVRRLYGVEAAVHIMNNTEDAVYKIATEVLKQWSDVGPIQLNAKK